MARLLTTIVALLLTVLTLSAQAQDGKFATNIPAQLSFTEIYAEEVITEIDDGETWYWDVPTADSKFTVTGRVSAQGIDFSTLDGNSQFKFFLEFFRVSGKLSDDPAYVPGATSVRIPLTAYDYDLDENVVAGHLSFSWTETEITFSADVAAPDTYSIILDHYIDENEVFEDTATFHFTFANRSLDRTVYYKGKATTKTKEYGKGEDADELDISTMDATGALDSTGPNVTISDPAEGARVTTDQISISGTASDPRGIGQVAVQANNGEFVPAAVNGNRWSLPALQLTAGVNTLRVRATDSEGNETITQRSVTLLTPLTVGVSGSGTVTKEFRGTTMQAPGASVTINAKANPGYAFSGWTGSVESPEPSISFVVEPGMTLTANFVPLPYSALNGRYTGLVQTDDGIPTGLVQLTLNKTGRFTAKFSLDGKKTRLKAVFDASGRAVGVATRKQGLPPLEYDLQIDQEDGSGTVRGTITDGTIVYALDTDRIVKIKGAPSPFAGVYNATLRPTDSEQPDALTSDGSATMKIKPNGKVKINGQLADGTRISTSSSVSQSGEVPLYTTLSARRTIVGGTLRIGGAANGPLSGTLLWKTAPGGESYPEGFTVQIEVEGSRLP